MSFARVISLFVLTWAMVGLVFLGTFERTDPPKMPRGSIEKEFNGVKYYIVPVNLE